MNRFQRAFDKFDKLVTPTAKFINYAGMTVTMLCMLLITGDVIGRYMRHPIPGALELSGLALAVMVSFGIAWTMIEKGHISISFITEKLSPKVQAIIDAVNYSLALVLWSLIIWQCYVGAFRTRQLVTDYLRIPLLPFKLLMTFGALLMCLVLISMIVKAIRKARAQ